VSLCRRTAASCWLAGTIDTNAVFANAGSQNGQAKARWVELCEQAAIEHEPTRLLKLIQEIDKLLREKQERTDTAKPNTN
jgi:hypothetical protein